jgi:peptidoglycan/xylan/chitin deacetylase (PgdA/CDA1 family)
VEALAALGHRATLFLIPQLAEEQAKLVKGLERDGAELGMHVHPANTDLGFPGQVGQLPPEEQHEVLRISRDRIAQALGAPPIGYRSGCFSASDATFGILADLGFTHGSVSLPGRNLPDIAAEWPGAAPFAHWAARGDRLSAGDLPFLEAPTAMDLRDVERDPSEIGDARHLRIEREGILDWGPSLIRHYISRQNHTGQDPKTLVVMTHNTREYADPDDPMRRTVEHLATTIEECAEEAGLQLAPVTLAQLRALVGEP